MKFLPSGTYLLVREEQGLSDFNNFAYGEIVAVGAATAINDVRYKRGALVAYGKVDRKFLGLGFSERFVLVKAEDVIGVME